MNDEEDMTKNPGATLTPSGEKATVMPALYKKLVAVSPERFAGKSFRLEQGYGYARAAHVLPVTGGQMADLASSYPVVFSADEPALAAIVLGLEPGTNLFVEPDGRWAEGFPVPDYVRRYPFLLIKSPQDQRYILCMDEAADMIEDGDERPFYVDGKNSELLDEVIESCIAFQRQIEATRSFAKALAEHGLLEPHEGAFHTADGRKVGLTGFRAVSKAKLDALPDQVILDWRKNGYLDLIYIHLVSLRSWPRLFHRAAVRRKMQAVNDA